MCIEIFHYFTIQLALYHNNNSIDDHNNNNNNSSSSSAFNKLNKILQPFLHCVQQQQSQQQAKRHRQRQRHSSADSQGQSRSRSGSRTRHQAPNHLTSGSEMDDNKHYNTKNENDEEGEGYYPNEELFSDDMLLLSALNTMTMQEINGHENENVTEGLSLGKLLLDHFTISYKHVLAFGREYGLIPYLVSDYTLYR